MKHAHGHAHPHLPMCLYLYRHHQHYANTDIVNSADIDISSNPHHQQHQQHQQHWQHQQHQQHQQPLSHPSQQSPLHRQVTATIHQIQCIRRDRQHCNQPISYPASRPARQPLIQTDRPTIGQTLIHTNRLTVRRTHTNVNRTRPSILNASTSGDASHATHQRRVRLT